MSRLVVHDEAANRLGGAVPSPAAAFLLSMIALPALFWLIMLKRTVTGGSTRARRVADADDGRAGLRLDRGQHPGARHADHRHQRPRQRLVRGARLRRARAAGAFPWPPRPRLPPRPRHALLPDGVGAEVLHLGRGDQPADPRERDVRRERHRSRRHRRLPGRTRAARHRPLWVGRLLRRAAGARRSAGHQRVCRRPRAHRRDQRDPPLPRRALPDRRARRLDRRGRSAVDPRRGPRPPRRRAGAGARAGAGDGPAAESGGAASRDASQRPPRRRSGETVEG